MIAGAFASTDHPLLAHIIPTRRCNLACEYCNEYDDFSKPVPTEAMFQRVDKLAALGTSVITISGGEPLLHPELDEIIQRIRKARHDRRADHERVSSGGGTHPTPQSRRTRMAANFDRQRHAGRGLEKSLKVLDKKLELLAEHADFHVNINSVVGAA